MINSQDSTRQELTDAHPPRARAGPSDKQQQNALPQMRRFPQRGLPELDQLQRGSRPGQKPHQFWHALHLESLGRPKVRRERTSQATSSNSEAAVVTAATAAAAEWRRSQLTCAGCRRGLGLEYPDTTRFRWFRYGTRRGLVEFYGGLTRT